ncbi:MAG: four helix bundle protein [Candidatus Terrybacteria bacterium CG10_big_fil_rev_8_21_14_0_10_41_10]|uniref:Four helix bundle protein n=1 Tax=Candidatus Terrybacteria bacterium CG10_big_fil_rev_8_21_14_0_10_41_10 TaxID=1975026 RepID=A0A2M8LBF1_9BACT|nr:MAG: four helix bundle protein [Candidatus Terrybacteria bacterium CG10_big_fil_rev_8_21_14_0_10_41_10]
MSELRTQNHNSKAKNDLKYRCYYYSIETIKFLGSLIKNDVNKVIVNQLLRSATSIGANIVEAKASSSRRDFIKFYDIALKSANESKYWFGLLRDATEADKTKINSLLQETEEISKMLASSLMTLKGRKS